MSADLLFIHPGGQRGPYQGLADVHTALAPPVWTALLAGAAAAPGGRATVHDANVLGWDEAVAGELLRRESPRLAVIMVYGHNPSASTQTMPAARRIAADLRRLAPGLPVAMGGLHPSALPERTLAEEQVDFVIQGDGLAAMPGLLELSRGAAGPEAVPGLWYLRGGSPASNPAAPAGTDLEELAGGYAWDLLPPLSTYRAHAMHCFQYFESSGRDDLLDVRSPYACIFTSLGCPYRCGYCSIHALEPRRGVRYWSLDRVAGWLEELARRGVRNIRIEDELFILDPRRVEEFCDRIIAGGLDLNLWAYGRVDTIAPGLLRKMKRAGISWICLGIESAVERVRLGVDKRITRDIRAVVEAIRGEGIHVLGNFMFGFPDDDLATMQATLDLALELRCEFVNFYTLMAYPGSPLYAKLEGSPDLPSGWEGYAQLGYETRPLPTRHLSSREVLRFRDEAFRTYFTDPGYLEHVGRLFGPRVVEHVAGMAAMPLRRRLLEEEA